MTNTFGLLIKRHRTTKRLGLRQFCRLTGYDPSNWSRIERGLLEPPRDYGRLVRIACALSFPAGSPERDELFDLAFLAAGRIPDYVMSDMELVAKLPLFFRTASGRRASPAELRELAELLRRS